MLVTTPKNCDVSVKKAIQQLARKLGEQSSPTLENLTLTDLTASSLVGTNASKLLESVTVGTGLDYTRPNLTLSHLGIEALTDPGADRIFFWDNSASASKWLAVGNSIAITTTTIDTIQDIQTTASPQFTGLTLSGLTQGSVVFAGTSGVISQDNSNVFWDNTNKRLGVGINTGFDARTGITVSGDVDILHTAVDSDDHAFELDINAAGYGDVKAIDIVYVSGNIGAGEDEEAILVNVDESDSGPGNIAALEVLTTDIGSAKIFGLEVGINVIPIEQLSGTFGNMAKAENDGVNALTEFTTSDPGDTNNIEIFVANGDTVLIGNTAKFEEIEFIFETFSNPSVKPTFEFSTGGTSFSSFTPADGTNGMRNNGVVLWLDSDIPSWATNTGGNYEIRITRTKGGNLAATPKEDLIQIGTAVEYVWNKDGDVNINSLTLATGIELGHASDTTITRVSAGVIAVEGTTVMLVGDAATAHAVLDGSVHSDSVADSVTRGSIIYGNATPKWDELVIGAADTFLGSDGTDLSYRTAAQVMASLSAEAAAAFSFNSQNLTGVGTIGCGAITGTSTATFEGASVTVGKASTTTGTIVLHDSNSANTITLTVPDISAGSLSFTLPPTDGANTNVLQTDGNGVLTWVAAAGGSAFTSKCSIYRNATQAITTGTWTKVQLNTEDYDTDGEFDNATNYRFEPDVTGYYSVGAVISITDLGVGKYMNVGIYKNGALWKVTTVTSVIATQEPRVPISTDMYLLDTDHIELWVYHNHGSDRNIEGTGRYTFMDVHRFA